MNPALLSLVTFFPLAGVLVLLFMKEENKNALRWTALITALATFAISLVMLGQFNAANADLGRQRGIIDELLKLQSSRH